MPLLMLLLILLTGCAGSAGRSSTPHGRLPARVHVFEDFETGIEQRWWLAGKVESENVPPGSRRACRGTVSKDFDDKMGDPTQRYTAVIFNPVPGPPVGRHTRLRYRYWIRGSDHLRVQIFSLTHNYHRRLVLAGLPQGEWHSNVVDMTLLRRPDGSGGPLSEDERIDDIQFYTDPSAELLIDDIVLYDEAPAEETEPFPARFLFTGGFDTGQQGKEWPGEFEIVAHEKPLKWKAARSVEGRLRISLRGPRPVHADPVRLRFRYRLDGADEFRVSLRNSTSSASSEVVTVRRSGEAWADFRSDLRGAPPDPDELLFLLDPKGSLRVDDVLLYVPASRD